MIRRKYLSNHLPLKPNHILIGLGSAYLLLAWAGKKVSIFRHLTVASSFPIDIELKVDI